MTDNPEIVPITFSQEYEAAVGALTAEMASPEPTDQALAITEEVISQNPSNYVAWSYRRRVLTSADFERERELTSKLLRECSKNYQLWQHRLWLVGVSGNDSDEAAFVTEILDNDSKNYHAWTHRGAVAVEFDWSPEKEASFARELIARDVRNNSAWSYLTRVLLAENRAEDLLVEAAAGAARAPRSEVALNAARAALTAGAALAAAPKLAETLQKYANPDSCPLSPAGAEFLLWCDANKIDRRAASEATPAAIARAASPLDPLRARFWVWMEGRAQAGFSQG